MNVINFGYSVAALPLPAFTAQPSLGGPYTAGDTVRLGLGKAGPKATLVVEIFELDGVDLRHDLKGLDWSSAGAKAGTLVLQVRATNAAGTVLSVPVTVELVQPLVAPSFTVQPAFGKATYTVGDTVSFSLGQAGPDASCAVESFTLGGSDRRGELQGLNWNTTGEAAGTIALRVRATSPGGSVLSAGVESLLEAAKTDPEPPVSGTASAMVRDTDWMVIPSGDAGKAYLNVRESGWSGDAVTALQYRHQKLNQTADMTVLNDPTGAWSVWADTPALTGRMALAGLPTDPCAVQVRVKRGTVDWSRPSRFKRIGDVHFGYDDSIVIWKGCVAETIPPTVYWGAGNIAGEGRQRVGDAVTAITAGDAGKHFEILTEDGRRYLRPTAAAVVAWKGGETYDLTLSDKSVVHVEIFDRNTYVVASPFWGIGAKSITEWLAVWGRIGISVGKASGKRILFRPGFHDLSAPDGAYTAKSNHHALDTASAPFVYGAADPAQPPMVARLFVATPYGGTGKRLLTVEDLDLFLPLALTDPTSPATVACLRIASGHDESSITIRRNRLRSDWIESRYGMGFRGGDATPNLHGLNINGERGLVVEDNTFTYVLYSGFFEGCDGIGQRNLITHIHADYINILASKSRTSGFRWLWNRLREHCGDQCQNHSDGMHSGYGRVGIFDGFQMVGNIWVKGFEGRACGGGLVPSIANYVQDVTEGTFTTGAALHDHTYNVLKRPGTITLHAPGTGKLDPYWNGVFPQPARDKAGYVFACVNDSEGEVTVRDPASGQSWKLGFMDRLVWHDTTGSWQVVLPNKSFQGAPYQNDAGISYLNSAYHHNIIFGLSAISAALLAGAGPVSLNGMRFHNNTQLHYVYDQKGLTHDLNGDGVFDERDGRFLGPTGARFAIGIKIGDVDPVGLSVFKNAIGTKPSDPGTQYADVWDDVYLGRAEFDTDANRAQHFAAPTGSWGPEIQTFKAAIEAARIRTGSAAAAMRTGTVGPADATPGYADFGARRITYPALVTTHSYPGRNSTDFPSGEKVCVWFEYPVLPRDLSGVALRRAGGAAVATTATVDGRRLMLSAALSPGVLYEVIVPAGAVVHYDDPGNSNTAIGTGDFRFTVNNQAFPNILSTTGPSYPGGDLSEYLRGTYFTLSGGLRFDTIYAADRASVMPRSGEPAIWSCEVQAATGQASFRINTTAGTGSNTLTVDAATGGVVSATAGRDGTDYGVIDVLGNRSVWKVWMRGTVSAPSTDTNNVYRYFFELSPKAGTPAFRRPMLVGGDNHLAPWVNVQALW